MSPDAVFSLANLIAISGWLLLLLAGRVRSVAGTVTGAAIPLVFALLYTSLIVSAWGQGEGGFRSVAEVRALFANDWLLVAGWVHYLAFDLFIGSWQVRDAARRRIPHLLIVPSLVLTFLFGPAGLLVYFLTRLTRSHSVTALEAQDC
jgi:hypothetical protein